MDLFKPRICAEAIKAVEGTLKSGWIGMGPKVEVFEQRFAEYVGSRYAVATNSATAALHLAMKVAGIEKGDTVLTTPLTFVSTNAAILYQKAKPFFIDVHPHTLNMDLNLLEGNVDTWTMERAKAIVVTHYAGNPVHLDQLYSIANAWNLEVIEDAAHACGASHRGRMIGSGPGLTCFSFGAVKNLAIGDGGMVTTNDPDRYERLKKLRWMGIDRSTFDRGRGLTGYAWEYDVPELGFKYHMNDISAAIGIEQLKELDAGNEFRGHLVATYKEVLRDTNAKFLKISELAESSHHLCVVRVPNRDVVFGKMRDAGISCGVHYTPNHYYLPFFSAKRYPLTETEHAYSEILSLPLHLHMTLDDAVQVGSTLKGIIERLPNQST
jgi:perosamine synthetase